MQTLIASSNAVLPAHGARGAAKHADATQTPQAADGADGLDFASLLAQGMADTDTALADTITLAGATGTAAGNHKTEAKDSKTHGADPLTLLDPAMLASLQNSAQPAIEAHADALPPGLLIEAAAHAVLQPSATTQQVASTAVHSENSRSTSGVGDLKAESKDAPTTTTTPATTKEADSSAAIPSFADHLATESAAQNSIPVHAEIDAITSAAAPGVTAPAASAPSAAPARLEVATPLGAPRWDSDFSQRVVWTANQRQQSAEIHITPPDLGPVSLTLNIDAQQSGQASVHFVSPHPEVRDAIEAALPRLREMMADAGIALGNATVGNDNLPSFQQSAGSETGNARGEAKAASAPSAFVPGVRVAARSGNGLVDTFA